MEHFGDFLFQLMKHGTNTLHVEFFCSVYIGTVHYTVQEQYKKTICWISFVECCWMYLPMYPTVPTRPLIVSPSGTWTAKPRSDIRIWPIGTQHTLCYSTLPNAGTVNLMSNDMLSHRRCIPMEIPGTANHDTTQQDTYSITYHTLQSDVIWQAISSLESGQETMYINRGLPLVKADLMKAMYCGNLIYFVLLKSTIQW